MRFDFPDYTPEELRDISALGAEKAMVKLSPGAEAMLNKKLVEAFRGRDRSFGNARYALSLINEAKMNMGLRVMGIENVQSLSKEELSLVKEEDILEIFEPGRHKKIHIPVDESLLRDSLEELNQLIGLDKVKEEVHELVKLVRFYKEIGKDVLNRFSLHTVFTGNPGTGKTTVARILGKIYKALGILERGTVIECDRQMLVAGHIGGTAEKTAKVVDQAKGGVLFIDEAYSLSKGGNHDYGQEAIETILKRMEDLRGELVVIAVGYPENMRTFLEANPGLRSRFDRKMFFEDYSPEQLLSIAELMLAKEEIQASEDAMKHLTTYFEYLYRNKSKYFGNARAVRKVIEQAIKNQHLRLALLPADERTPAMLRELILSDVTEFKPGNDQLFEDGKQGRVGF